MKEIFLSYGEMRDSKGEIDLDKLKSLVLFGFADAGYASLAQSKSQESRILVLGRPIHRDGMIHALGPPVDFFSRKIVRAVKSTISAEAVALSNLADMGIWMHHFLSKILTGRVFDIRVDSTDGFPLSNPFVGEPSKAEMEHQYSQLIKVLFPWKRKREKCGMR